MSKQTLIAVLALGVLAWTGQAVAQTDTITVTVSLAETIEVSLDNNAWNIGAIALGSTNGPTTFEAEVGNIQTDLSIKGSDAAGGWTLGSPAAEDVFEVSCDAGAGAVVLTDSDQVLQADVSAYGSVSFGVTYNAPTSDTQGGGVDQSFTITVTAADGR